MIDRREIKSKHTKSAKDIQYVHHSYQTPELIWARERDKERVNQSNRQTDRHRRIPHV